VRVRAHVLHAEKEALLQFRPIPLHAFIRARPGPDNRGLYLPPRAGPGSAEGKATRGPRSHCPTDLGAPSRPRRRPASPVRVADAEVYRRVEISAAFGVAKELGMTQAEFREPTQERQRPDGKELAVGVPAGLAARVLRVGDI
jgi:hypothetical protein